MTLKWVLTTKRMRPHAQLRNKLQQKISKLESHLEHFPADAVQLQVNLERHPRNSLFEACLTLRTPARILRARKPGADPIPAFDLAVRALLRELGGLKSDLRRESRWQENKPYRWASLMAPNAASARAVAR